MVKLQETKGRTMSDLLTQERLSEIFTLYDPPYEWENPVGDMQSLRKHIQAQQQLLIVAVNGLKTLMDNNPTDEQVMAYLQEYAHLIETVPPIKDSPLIDDGSLWQTPPFDGKE